jgi:hypothetical protein
LESRVGNQPPARDSFFAVALKGDVASELEPVKRICAGDGRVRRPDRLFPIRVTL